MPKHRHQAPSSDFMRWSHGTERKVRKPNGDVEPPGVAAGSQVQYVVAFYVAVIFVIRQFGHTFGIF